MLLDCGVSNPNFYCHFDASANAEQSNVGCNYSRFDSDPDLDYPFEFHWTPEVQKIDLDQCLVDAFAAEFPSLHDPGLSYNEDMPQLTPLRDVGALEVPIDYPPEYYSFGGAERVDSMLLDDPNNSYMPLNTENAHMMDVDMVSTDPWLVPGEAFTPLLESLKLNLKSQQSLPVSHVKSLPLSTSMHTSLTLTRHKTSFANQLRPSAT